MSRIFTDVNETHALLTNLYHSLCRSDQDAWLRKMNLTRVGGFSGFGSQANLLNPHSNNVDGISQIDSVHSSPANNNHNLDEDSKPTRGYSNVAALIAAASPSKQQQQRSRNISGGVVTSPTKKFDVGNKPRVTQALRLAGEDHTEEDETARPKTFTIASSRGAAARNGELQGWFDDLLGQTQKQEEQGEGEEATTTTASTTVSIEIAKKEYCEQEHFGLPNPDKEFEKAIQKFAPGAEQRGGLNIDEFACIFARFDYD